MPTVYIWRPHGEENPYGHVALETDKYYFSFWAQDLESDGSDKEIQEESFLPKSKRLKRKSTHLLRHSGIKMIEGCLVFHQDLDKEYEGEQDPIEYQIDATVTNEDLNSIYEEFLCFNGINPEDVTLARGEELYKTRKEYEELPPEEARLEIEEPKVSVAKTGYIFFPKLVTCKEDGDSLPFYHEEQSCVSFAFNLLQMAWLKSHPDRPIPILIKEPGDSLFMESRYPYEVPWFEQQVVQNYLLDPDTLLENSATSPLKYSKGSMMLRLTLLNLVHLALSYLPYRFPWLVGPLNFCKFYSYSCKLYPIFCLDYPNIWSETLTLIDWFVLYGTAILYYVSFLHTLFFIFEIATFLLDNTGIKMTLLIIMLVWLLIRGLEEKLSIMEKAGKAIATLVFVTYSFFLFYKSLLNGECSYQGFRNSILLFF